MGAAGAAASSAPFRAPQPRLAPPPTYNGSAVALDGWLREMRKHCRYYGITTDAEGVRFCSAQLSGAALDWWDALADEARTVSSGSFAAFERALRSRFQPVTSAQTARATIDRLQQGAKQSVHDYISSFRRLLSAVPTMSEDDRVHAFLRGLKPALQAQVRVHDPTSMDEAINKAARIGGVAQFAAAAAAAGSVTGIGVCPVCSI